MAVTPSSSYTNETFKNELMRMSTGIVWKNSAIAKSSEVASNMYLAELYMVANRGMLTWEVIRAFPRAVLKNCGVLGNDIETFSSNKSKIPENLRPTLVAEYQAALCAKNPITGHPGYAHRIIVDEVTVVDGVEYTIPRETTEYVEVYLEKNNYYRMLNGLPDTNDNDFIYNTDPRWPTDTPIHLMSLVDRISMDDAGVLAELVKKYPMKKYLRYCGRKMIDIYEARSAERFEILWMQNATAANFTEDFKTLYNAAKNQVNAVYYSDAFRKTNDLYDNFMAMCVLFMTIQTMMYRYLGIDTVRDFYDTESLKYVYDSYSVPFYQEIPLEYHRKIVKNINRLISYKGSSKVFFDLFDIFDLATMDIYTYYIKKVHLMDKDGNPVFKIKTDAQGNELYDEFGDPILDPSCYSIGFARGGIYEDPSLAVSDPANEVEAATLTDTDPYWVSDKNLLDKLNDESFNFNETKYIGVQTVFDLLKISFENAYLFKMISDNKALMETLTFRWTDLDMTVSIFDMFIYLASIFCKVHGYTGEISSRMPFVSACLGYDFKENITDLKKYIDENPVLHGDDDLLRAIDAINLTNINSISTCLDNLYNLRDLLIQRYTDAHSVAEFETYKGLYDTLMTSKIVEEVYSKSDGTMAESFEDLLSDCSLDLANRLATLQASEMESEMTLVIDKLEELITACRYMPFSAGMDSSGMMNSLFKILAFFKSAKAELTGYNIIYVLTMRGISFIKLLDKAMMWKYWDIKLSSDFYQIDVMRYITSTLKTIEDFTGLKEIIPVDSHYQYYITEHIKYLWDSIRLIYVTIRPFTDDTHSIDTLIRCTIHGAIKSVMDSNDQIELTDHIIPNGVYNASFKDKIAYLLDNLWQIARDTYINDQELLQVIYKSWIWEITRGLTVNSSNLTSDQLLQELDTIQINDYPKFITKMKDAHYNIPVKEVFGMSMQGVSWDQALELMASAIQPVDAIVSESTQTKRHSEHIFTDYIRTSQGDPL